MINSLLSISLTAAERATLHAAGQDADGMMRSMVQKTSDLMVMLRTVIVALPEGPNKTTLAALLAALTATAGADPSTPLR